MVRRLLVILLLLATEFATLFFVPGESADRKTGLSGVPLRDVAPPLRNAWLRFHEDDLCLGIDTVFVFYPNGMEIWCRIKDEKSYQQLTALLKPLQKSFKIEVYPTYQGREKKPYSLDDDNPPPSFLTNSELRAFLRDPSFNPFEANGGAAEIASNQGIASPQLRNRLKIFSNEIIDWLTKMDRLARDLPDLASAGFDVNAVPDMRLRARAVCQRHVRDLGKYASRLENDLRHALPPGSGKLPESKSGAAQPAAAMTASYDNAILLSEQAREIEQRILKFIYPQAHTVDLADLREPAMLDELKALQKSASEFEGGSQKAK